MVLKLKLKFLQERGIRKIIMTSWNERIVVNKTPNFYMEAVELLDDYFQWKTENNEGDGQGKAWEDTHLVDHPENFTMSVSDIDLMYHDVHQFLLGCKIGAAPILSSSKELHPYFTIKAPERTEEMPGFLKEALVMSDVQSAKELTRNEFATCSLFGLHEIAGSAQLEDFEIGSAEQQALYEQLSNPDFDMKAVFDTVAAAPLSDGEQMMLLRFFQDIDIYYKKVRDTLIQIESVCRENYTMVNDRFKKKVQELETVEGRAYYMELIDRANLHIEELRCDEPIHMEIGIISYGSLSIRFSSWKRLKLRLSAGLLFDELSSLEDKVRHRDKMTQMQLKAIADPTRYKIIRQLSIRPHYVQELADELDLTAATLSHHLTHLLQVMLVGVSIKGRKSYYSLNADELSRLSEALNLMAQRSRMED